MLSQLISKVELGFVHVWMENLEGIKGVRNTCASSVYLTAAGRRNSFHTGTPCDCYQMSWTLLFILLLINE